MELKKLEGPWKRSYRFQKDHKSQARLLYSAKHSINMEKTKIVHDKPNFHQPSTTEYTGRKTPKNEVNSTQDNTRINNCTLLTQIEEKHTCN